MSFLLYWVLSAFFFLLIVKNIVKQYFRASLIAKLVKNLPAVQETRVPSLGQKILGGGRGNPLQYSCLENPMDRSAWRAAVRRVSPWGHNSRTYGLNHHPHHHSKQTETYP